MKLRAIESRFASHKSANKRTAGNFESASQQIGRERLQRKQKRNDRRHKNMLRLTRSRGIRFDQPRPEAITPPGASLITRIKWAWIRTWRKLFLVG